MSYNISKAKLEKFSLFSICSKRFGYGHYNRLKNLILILKNKQNIFNHYSYGVNFKTKKEFLKKLEFDINLNKKIILDISNRLFLNRNTIKKIKEILTHGKRAKIYIIDEPTEINLSTILGLNYTKTLIPFEAQNSVKRKLDKIKNKAMGFKYFIYAPTKIKKKNKKNDLTISFGGSDNYGRTLYVLKLLKNLKTKKKIVVIIGKFFKKNYQKKIINFCKNSKYKTKFFTKNFYNILNDTKMLVTNSGLTKYEGILHNIPVIVFSDTKESQKIDEVFIRKTNQFHFSYLKKEQNDMLKLKKILNKKIKPKLFDKNKNKSYINNIKKFFS